MPAPEKRRPPTGPSEGAPVPKPAKNLAAALDYAALGYPAFALKPKGKAPATKHGKDDATTDPAALRAMIADGHNVGILWPPGVLALDLDVPKDEKREPLPGARAYADHHAAEHEARFPELRAAPRARSRADGVVWTVRLPDGVSLPSTVGAVALDGGGGIDLRGDGRTYTAAPPSVVPPGRYTWERPLVPLADLPVASDALLAYVTAPKPSRNGQAHDLGELAVGGAGAAKTVDGDPEVYAAGVLEGTRSRLGGVKTGRNAACFSEGLTLGRWVGGYKRAGLPGLDEHTAAEALRDAMKANGDYDDDPHKADGTIRNALREGMASAYQVTHKPRPVAPAAPLGRDPGDPGPSEADVPADPDAPAEPTATAANSPPRRRKARAAAPADEGPRLPNLVRLSTVEPVAVEHLDDGRLALGKLTLMVGDAGAGKTHIALSIAANLTRGRPPFPIALSPGGKYREPANVLALIGEDGLGDTIRGRFDAAEGDASRFYALTGVTVTEADGETRERDVDLTQLDVLDHAMRELRPALVIVDPVQVYLGPNADMHKANEVRAALKGAAKLAERYNAALLIIGHLNKGNGGGKALYRALGSIDFVAIARSVLVVGEHNGVSAVAHAKANLSPKAPTLTYTLEGGALAWTGTTAASADELTSGPAQPYDSPKLAEAATWLGDMLDGQARKVTDLEQLAKRAGIAWRTVRRASDELGVTKRKIGTVGTESYWEWEIEG